MAKISNKIEESKEPEKEKITEKVIKEWFPEKPKFGLPLEEKKEEIIERKELTREEREKKEKLMEQISKIAPPPQAKEEVKKEAEKIKRLAVKGKIKHLLDLAQSKGLVFSVAVARKLNDAYLLDIFHDILAKEGLYKKFLE